jgi:hypothetical protein
MTTLPTDELLRRATGLLALGNTPARVQAALHNMGATPEQIEEVMAAVETRTRQKQRSDSQSLWWLGGAVGLVMLTLCGVATVSFLQPSRPASAVDSATASALVTTQTTPQSQAVQSLLTAIPADLLPRQLPTNVPADFMAATPVVVRASDSQSDASCPKDPYDAARLFGGVADSWTYDSSTYGWTMTHVGAGVEVTVPTGMTAGYMTIVDTIQMVRVEGPVTIANVNFIAISCG